MISCFFKKLVNASLSDAPLPEGLTIKRVGQDKGQKRNSRFNEIWWPVYSGLLGNIDGQESSPVMYSESHGPATTLTLNGKAAIVTEV